MVAPVAVGLTRADLDDLPDDGRRYELIDGRLFVSPLARRRHQWVVMQVAHRLKQYADVHGGTVYPGVNVDLSDETHLEPDVVFSRDDDISGLGFAVAPELVVEVSSPSTRAFDLGEKKDRYAAAGCQHFWFVDLDADTIVTFDLGDDGRYREPVTHRRGETATTDLLPGLTLDINDLLGEAVE